VVTSLPGAVVVMLYVSLMVTLAYLLLTLPARVPIQACPTSMPCVAPSAAYDAVTVAGAGLFAVPAVAVAASSDLAQQQPELRLCPHVPSLHTQMQLVWRAATC